MDFAVRLMFSAPLLFIALLMIADPEGAMRLGRQLVSTLRTLEFRVSGLMLPVAAEPEPAPGRKWPVVAMGIFLAAGAVYVLASVHS
jgi:hypothetical protein